MFSLMFECQVLLKMSDFFDITIETRKTLIANVHPLNDIVDNLDLYSMTENDLNLLLIVKICHTKWKTKTPTFLNLT